MTLRPESYLQFQDDRVFDALEALEAQAASAERLPTASRSRGSSRIRT
jgi:hypothetical protein